MADLQCSMPRLIRATVAAAAIAAVTNPAAALASTVKTAPVDPELPNLRGVQYTASSFERNDVTISKTSTGNIVVTDPGAIISAQAGCSLQLGSNGHTAICHPGFQNEFVAVDVFAGDQDDTVSVPAAVEAGAHIDGGTGLDRLTGGPGPDQINGGLGREAIMDGGAGGDTFENGAVTYESRTAPVKVDLDLDRIGDDGEAGEGDYVGRGVTKVTGGSGSDELIGGDSPATLDGGPGDDFLNGHGAANILLAGPGADAVFSRDGLFDSVDCGVDSDPDVTIADPGDQLRNCP